MKKILLIFLSIFFTCNLTFAKDGIYHKKQKLRFNGRPVVVNSIIISPKSKYTVKLSYGGKTINTLQRVKSFAKDAEAYAAINASFFKPNTGTPLGLSIVNKKLITGPLFQRSVFGITRKGNYKISKVNLLGDVTFGQNNIKLYNINQPIITRKGLFLFNSYWGNKSPKTNKDYVHITVVKNRIYKILNESSNIPSNGYVIVGHCSLFKNKPIKLCQKVKYNYKLSPFEWNKMQYAFAAGPQLVKDGKRLIDKQKFSSIFLWTKAPRSAIGIRKDGSLILVAVDGRQKGFSEGVTLTELANIMLNLKAYEAMNLDGGSSTQLVLKNKLVNRPSNIVGARVTNALIVTKKRYRR